MKKFELCVDRKTFEKDGEVYVYYDCFADIFGETIKFKVDDKDKQLFKYLMKFSGDKGGNK